MREIKEEKAKTRIRDEEIKKLASEVGEKDHLLEKMYYQNSYLRKLANVPEDTMITSEELKLRDKLDIERYKALNKYKD